MRKSLANVYNVFQLSVTNHPLGIDLPKARHHAIITSVRVTIRCICIHISISASWDLSGRSTCSAENPHIFRTSEKVLDLSCKVSAKRSVFGDGSFLFLSIFFVFYCSRGRDLGSCASSFCHILESLIMRVKVYFLDRACSLTNNSRGSKNSSRQSYLKLYVRADGFSVSLGSGNQFASQD